MRPVPACLRIGGSVAALACAVAVGCGSRSGVDACSSGGQGCPCNPAEPCVPGLRCAAGICVEPSGGAPSTRPTTGGRPGSSGGAAQAGGSFNAAGSFASASGVGGAPAGTGGRGPSSNGGTAAFSGGGVSHAGAAGSAGTGGVVREPPVVLILLDGSSSMYDSQVWTPTYEALTGPGGPIVRYEDRVRFGFASYRGTARTAEDDFACAEITSVPFTLSNGTSIRDVYASLEGRRRGRIWETPTAHALNRVMTSLLAEPVEAEKFILLISDGAPDTCMTRDIQCGQDRAVFALQTAFSAGIETRAIGIGFGDVYPGCAPETARCGSDHFQDLANAGSGFPVVAPPDGYAALPCAAETGGQLLSQYSARGGPAPLFWTMSPTEVANAFDAVLAEILAR